MPDDAAKSAAAERQRRCRERRRRGERIVQIVYDDALLEALIESNLLAAWDADDPEKIGRAIVKAARNGVSINVRFTPESGH